VVEDWEYRTAYLWSLQVRMRQDLHLRLVDWARREGRSLDDLAVEVLRDAIAHRGG
jgi:predicted HicB family RNase H-like nuclease